MVTHKRPRADAVFRAIAEPTRRRLLDELARGSRPAGALARRFPFSRPAVARHLRVLRQAGLVRARSRGRHRIYELTPGPLQAVQTWIGQYETFWNQRLDELTRYLERRGKDEKRSRS
jgi:DNA-binding transcriptional ArsR family regulator